MGDVLGIAEVANALSQPICKLVEGLCAGCGKVYEPIHVKRMAEAKAWELNVMAEAVRVNLDVPIVYQDGIVRVDSQDVQNLAQRAAVRVGHQEMTKQLNIESIVGHAAADLKKEVAVPDVPVDKDWMMRFFEYAGGVNNEDVQKLWAKVLAGEIKCPGAYSPRTLDVLRNLSKTEAALFELLSKCCICNGERVFLYADDDLLREHGMNYGMVVSMADAGLINSDYISNTLKAEKEKRVFVYTDEYVCVVNNPCDYSISFTYGLYSYTEAGRELLNLVGSERKFSFLRDVARDICEKNKKLVFGVYKVNCRTGEYWNYNTENLLNHMNKP